MRKLLALAMVALFALTLSIAALGCGQKAAETPAATDNSGEMTGGSDTMADSSAMMADSSQTMGSESSQH